jgi:hypothetical protein
MSQARAADIPVTDEAQRIYQQHGDAIYQVQVIDLASGKKNSIGSGFQFSAEGLIATNYHVVAEAVQHPADNRLEYLHDKGERGSLKILTADVVHDIAILQMEKPGKNFLSLGTSSLPKGSRLFSLGNPHDIGFTIIEGTYNGLSRESFVDKIHFSGSLNPGMSGGPALDHKGRVIGINVLTAGNQISFLVPVEYLNTLKDALARDAVNIDFPTHAAEIIGKQLQDSQQANMALLLNKEWEKVPFGTLSVPGRIHDVFKCWGGPAHQEKDPYLYFRSTCSTQDRLFLQEGFTTGTYTYRYDLINGKDDMNLARFYTFYEREYASPIDPLSTAGENDVTNFTCDSGFVDMAAGRWKSSFCVRQYKKYPGIYDMQFYMALVGAGRTGVMITVSAAGVSKDNALAFAGRFMNNITAATP